MTDEDFDELLFRSALESARGDASDPLMRLVRGVLASGHESRSDARREAGREETLDQYLARLQRQWAAEHEERMRRAEAEQARSQRASAQMLRESEAVSAEAMRQRQPLPRALPSNDHDEWRWRGADEFDRRSARHQVRVAPNPLPVGLLASAMAGGRAIEALLGRLPPAPWDSGR